jgi:hypothetical protein
LYPSTLAWISYEDLWELANTAIKPMTMNRLPHLFKVEIGNWVKTGVVAGSHVSFDHLRVRAEFNLGAGAMLGFYVVT